MVRRDPPARATRVPASKSIPLARRNLYKFDLSQFESLYPIANAQHPDSQWRLGDFCETLEGS